MFFHTKNLQYAAKPDRPDPIYAKQLQEVLGGQWGEMSVMMNYLFQGWNCRAPAKYRDMLMDIGTEEIAPVEMLATMIARLLEADGLGAPPVPHTFPAEQQINDVASQYWNCSEGDAAKAGRWASGPSPDGLGEFEYVKTPKPLGPKVEELMEVDPRLHGTPKLPKEPIPS